MYFKKYEFIIRQKQESGQVRNVQFDFLTPCNLYSITCIMGLIAIKKMIHCYFPKLDSLDIIQNN